MAITTQEQAASFEYNENNEASYTRTFIVESDDRIGPFTAANTVAVNFSITPRVSYYSTGLESDTTAIAKGFSTSNLDDNDGFLWQVTVNYGAIEPYTDDNPLSEPLEYSWSTTQGTRLIDFDASGTAIRNFCGEPYADALEIDDPRFCISITRNEGTFNTAIAAAYRNAVNSDTFQGYSPGRVKCSGISTQRIFDPKYGFYFKTSYQFDVDLNGFEKKVIDAGFNELKTVSGTTKPYPILFGGQPVAEPWPLGTDGKALVYTATPIVRTWVVYPSLPFSAFGF